MFDTDSSLGFFRPVLIALALGFAVVAFVSHSHAVHALFSVSSGGDLPYGGRKVEVTDAPLPGDQLQLIASALVGRQVPVVCTTIEHGDGSGAAGYTNNLQNGRPWIRIDTTRCRDLNHFRALHSSDWRCIAAATSDCPGAVDQSIFALHVLAHESAHATGILNEWRADCVGYRNTGRVAAMLGASADHVAALQHYFATFYRSVERPATGYLQSPSDCPLPQQP